MMDVNVLKRKIKALDILEKVNQSNRNQTLLKYHSAVKQLENIDKSRSIISNNVKTIEANIVNYVNGNLVNSLELIQAKYEYLDGMYSLHHEYEKMHDHMSNKVEDIKTDLISHNAKLNLVKEKNIDEKLLYRKTIECIREAD
jgi:hypothetical protein